MSQVAEVERSQLTVLRVELTQKMVGNILTFMLRNLVCGDIKTLVDLHFIGVDYFGREILDGEIDRKAGFSGAGGAHDDDDLVFFTAVVVMEGRRSSGDDGGGSHESKSGGCCGAGETTSFNEE